MASPRGFTPPLGGAVECPEVTFDDSSPIPVTYSAGDSNKTRPALPVTDSAEDSNKTPPALPLARVAQLVLLIGWLDGSTEPAPLCRPRHSWFVSGRGSAASGSMSLQRSLDSTPDACTCRRGWCATCRRARRDRSRSAFRRPGQLTASRSASSHSRSAQQGRWHGSAVISAYRFKAAA